MKKILKNIYYPSFGIMGMYTLIYILLSFFFNLPDWRTGFKLVMGTSLLLSLLFLRSFNLLAFLESKIKKKSVRKSRFLSGFLELIDLSGVIAFVIFLYAINRKDFSNSRLLYSFFYGSLPPLSVFFSATIKNRNK